MAKVGSKYTRGKISEEDEGQLMIRTAIKNGTIIIDFSKPLSWLGLGKLEAIEFANILLEYARKLEKMEKMQ